MGEFKKPSRIAGFELSKSERGLHPTVRVEVNFIDFNLVDFECTV